ncbi:hypothetical protein [Streptomyces albus]|uniref:hypothetical protein n=1 Tax=Streptomyces sp. NRRL F-5917 TaxID=1463873 RepID=UPI0004C11776|nr:hypothetical protein [Streptomyces sp. NRRL F-5917]KPC91904.1 hypothetical protein ADL27_27280 [Streptomyces sp. NRRL F-6602]
MRTAHATTSNRTAVEAARSTDTIQPGAHYVSPAARRHAALVAQQQADAERDDFRMPTTAAELDAMSYADRARVYTTDPALYDRLTGHTPASHPARSHARRQGDARP